MDLGRLRRWWREAVIGDFRRELPAIIAFHRDVSFIRDVNGIPVGISGGPVYPSITCPRCGMTSYSPEDVRQGYCGNCNDQTSQGAQQH